MISIKLVIKIFIGALTLIGMNEAMSQIDNLDGTLAPIYRDAVRSAAETVCSQNEEDFAYCFNVSNDECITYMTEAMGRCESNRNNFQVRPSIKYLSLQAPGSSTLDVCVNINFTNSVLDGGVEDVEICVE